MRRFRTVFVVLACAGVAAALAACSTTSTPSGSSAPSGSTPKADAGAFPVTMTHAFGSTTIKRQPERVVTLGWGVADAALSVGVVPVAMEYQVYPATSDGIPSWTKAKLASMHVATPTVLPKSTEAPAYSAIIKAHPDLILATYSGITKPQYEQLSKIAPTVAYTGQPYTTPWQDVLEQTAKALGRSAQADQVLARINKQISSEAAAHPELAGKTVAAVWDVGGTFYVYRKDDARVAFMLQLGLKNAPSVDTLANGTQSFYYTLSYEKVPQLSSDILVTYADTQGALNTFLGKDYAKAMPAVKRGAVAALVGQSQVAAVSPPTALSLPAALPGLVAKLSAAAAKVSAG